MHLIYATSKGGTLVTKLPCLPQPLLSVEDQTRQRGGTADRRQSAKIYSTNIFFFHLRSNPPNIIPANISSYMIFSDRQCPMDMLFLKVHHFVTIYLSHHVSSETELTDLITLVISIESDSDSIACDSDSDPFSVILSHGSKLAKALHFYHTYMLSNCSYVPLFCPSVCLITATVSRNGASQSLAEGYEAIWWKKRSKAQP